MKSGRSLQEIAAELERQVGSRKDYVAPLGAVQAVVDGAEVKLANINGAPLAVNTHAHSQLSDHLGIPKKYYDRMRAERPELLAENLNGWFQQDAKEQRLFRTLDGRVRGFLSKKFRPMDNFDLAGAVLPTLMAAGAQVMSSELTETRMYIKAILPDLSDTLPEGLAWGVGHHIFESKEITRVVAAITISNSDVGAGTLSIVPSVFTALCTNLAALEQSMMRKYHVGRSMEVTENFEVFRDETRLQDDKALWMKVEDVTKAAFSKEGFRLAIDRIRYAGEQKIESQDLTKVVEVATRRLALPDGQQNSVLSWLAKGGQLNQWGLSSAITRAAQDADSYEVASDMERIGGQVLALPAASWKEIATAA